MGSMVLALLLAAAAAAPYDPAKGDPGRGIPPGTSFDDLPDNWTCPKCNAGKNMFVAVDE